MAAIPVQSSEVAYERDDMTGQMVARPQVGSSARSFEAPAPALAATRTKPDTVAVATGAQGGGLRSLVARHAAANGVPFALANAVVQIESRYNPRASNRSGAMGLMQIKTQTARGLGFSGSASQLLDAETNVKYAMAYLAGAYKMSGGDVCGTVMRYQSGHYARRMSGADRSYCSKARAIMAQA